MATADLTVLPPEDAPPNLTDLPDELISSIACSIAEDLCDGVRSLIALSRCDRQLRSVALHSSTLARCAAVHDIDAGIPSLALLDVIETTVGLGTNRIYFSSGRRPITFSADKAKPTLRPGSSMPRLIEFALLMRRHPTLRCFIEGHEGPQEGLSFETPEGHTIRAARGVSHERAEATKAELLNLECLKALDKRGNKVWSTMPRSRFAGRVECRGWDDGVAEAAGWTGGLGTCHAEVFFVLNGVEVPRRDEGYAVAEAARERSVGWQRRGL